MTQTLVDEASHRKLATELFNSVWTLLDKPERTMAEDDQMLHAAHASRYHWGVVGTARESSIGEWQISRVYVALQRSEPAIHHARRALEIARDGNIGPFFVAYAYEALARGHAVKGDRDFTKRYIDLARDSGKAITEDDEKKMLEDDLATISVEHVDKKLTT
jgi:hypothetical protein